jgi:hypothetical protein
MNNLKLDIWFFYRHKWAWYGLSFFDKLFIRILFGIKNVEEFWTEEAKDMNNYYTKFPNELKNITEVLKKW